MSSESPIAQQHPVVEAAASNLPPPAVPIVPQLPQQQPQLPQLPQEQPKYRELNDPVVTPTPTPTSRPCRNNGMMMILAAVLLAAIVYLIFYGDELFAETKKSSKSLRFSEF